MSLAFGITRTSVLRNHIVMASGSYNGGADVNSQGTAAVKLTIHGGGSSIAPIGGDDGTLVKVEDVPTTITNLIFKGNGSAGNSIQSFASPCVVSHSTFVNAGAINAGGDMTLDDVDIQPRSDGIDVFAGSHLTANRLVVHGGFRGINTGSAGATVNISNMLIYGTSDLALNLVGTTGTVAFSTIADAGADTGTGAQAITCGAGTLKVQSAIVWTPSSIGRIPVDANCQVSTSIIGPPTVAGSINTDPAFVNEANHDYHITASSVAKDAVDAGPATDFEGDPRPQGPRFDIGADEVKE